MSCSLSASPISPSRFVSVSAAPMMAPGAVVFTLSRRTVGNGKRRKSFRQNRKRNSGRQYVGYLITISGRYTNLWSRALMTESERLSKLRHDLSNPLSALLAETQLLLLNENQIDPETLSSLREIEALAIRMRAMLRDI
jgi:signal transduction histidine kinase